MITINDNEIGVHFFNDSNEPMSGKLLAYEILGEACVLVDNDTGYKDHDYYYPLCNPVMGVFSNNKPFFWRVPMSNRICEIVFSMESALMCGFRLDVKVKTLKG